MRIPWMILTGLTTAAAGAQNVTSVYNRDTHVAFSLKKVTVESTVIGPLVRTDTWLDYDNPYKSLTEATLNFELPASGALGGFAYFYGKEYVPGKLMDKDAAWQIYTAITSRNRDPGIMEQWSSTSYHCQIFPIHIGEDLRIRIWTVGMLEPKQGELTVPKPNVPRAKSYYGAAQDASAVEPEWALRSVKSPPLEKVGGDYRTAMTNPVEAVAERFKDGRVYVAGLIRPERTKIPNIEIHSAYYIKRFGTPHWLDVTAQVRGMTKKGIYEIPANNASFGDPAPYVLKSLVVNYSIDGHQAQSVVEENSYANLIRDAQVTPNRVLIPKLHEAKLVTLDQQTTAFSGWLTSNRTLTAVSDGQKFKFRPVVVAKGSDTARIWAQQMLAGNRWSKAKAMRFSLKYGVPCSATALLAVPKAEWKAYREKLAEARRQAREAARDQRNWSGQRNQNWNASGGGDPEIRVSIPGAESVRAILPDRRIVDLKRDGDEWGGNFEIPADAKEGSYQVRILAHMKDGSVQEKSWKYDVDRTPPKGVAEFLTVGADLVLQVTSEAGLADVSAYSESGQRWKLEETKPGTYRVILPSRIRVVVVMKDRAGNKGEITLESNP